MSGNLVFLETGKIGPIYQVPNSVSSNKYSQNFSSHFQIGSHNISLKGKSWDNLYFLDALASLRPRRPRIAIDNLRIQTWILRLSPDSFWIAKITTESISENWDCVNIISIMSKVKSQIYVRCQMSDFKRQANRKIHLMLTYVYDLQIRI